MLGLTVILGHGPERPIEEHLGSENSVLPFGWCAPAGSLPSLHELTNGISCEPLPAGELTPNLPASNSIACAINPPRDLPTVTTGTIQKQLSPPNVSTSSPRSSISSVACQSLVGRLGVATRVLKGICGRTIRLP